MSRRYIGVDLGAWLGEKTRIAVLVKSEGGLVLETLEREPLRKSADYVQRDATLVARLEELAKEDALLGVDAPLSLPASLKGEIEPFYALTTKPSQKHRQINNPYLFDNSARFVLDVVDEVVLAPCATYIGAYTARMSHLLQTYKDILNPVRDPDYQRVQTSIKTLEVYPRATLKILLDFQKIPSYKKSAQAFQEHKERMLLLVKPYFTKTSYNDLANAIKNDDEYDALICALTLYLIETYGAYLPAKEDWKKFTNSFIYMPKLA